MPKRGAATKIKCTVQEVHNSPPLPFHTTTPSTPSQPPITEQPRSCCNYRRWLFCLSCIGFVGFILYWNMAIVQEEMHSQCMPLDTAINLKPGCLQGSWFQVARLRNGYPNTPHGCDGAMVRMDYKGGEYRLTLRCADRNGLLVKRAWSVKPNAVDNNCKFDWHFPGSVTPHNIWVVETGISNEYVVLASPDLSFAWVLSRASRMDNQQLDNILKRLSRYCFSIKAFARLSANPICRKLSNDNFVPGAKCAACAAENVLASPNDPLASLYRPEGGDSVLPF